jgi:hypothetical protein
VLVMLVSSSRCRVSMDVICRMYDRIGSLNRPVVMPGFGSCHGCSSVEVPKHHLSLNFRPSLSSCCHGRCNMISVLFLHSPQHFSQVLVDLQGNLFQDILVDSLP